MIGYLALMSVVAGAICLGAYWINWENQDAQTRPRFTTQLASDWAVLFRCLRGTPPAAVGQSSTLSNERTRARQQSA